MRKMIVGKPGSHKRALRRHHDKRKKEWVRKTLGRYFNPQITQIFAD